jgi:hypothetical protein
MGTSKVVLLDLRGAPDDTPPQIAGGVVVLDDADSLLKHAETYLSLLGEDMVPAVVCVAVGESGTNNPLDGAVLTVPPALRHATVLWVGDPHGVDWAPDSAPPRPADQPGNALDSLVAVLQVPAVFDRVVAVAGELPSAAANPGIRLVSSAADPVVLSETRAAAVRSLCATDRAPSHGMGAALLKLDAPHDQEGAVLSGPVAKARADAVRRLDHVAELARVLGTPKALFGTQRPTEHLGSQVVWAGQAAENYRRYLVELLNRMDGQLQIEHPPVEKVMELGVQDSREARGGEIVAGLRQLVDDRLDDGTPLPVLAQELRFGATTSGPQGCTGALETVGQRQPLALDMPEFSEWPLSLATLPLAFLTCGVLAFLLGPGWLGWVAGGLLAAAWFGSGWLLLARRPGKETERGLGLALLPAMFTYGVAAVLGVLAGGFTAKYVRELVHISLLNTQLLIVGAVALSVAAVVLSWRWAVRRWRKRLQVAALRNTVADLTRITEETAAREWQPMRRRRAVATAASEVAGGLEEIARTLEEAGSRLFVAPVLEPATDGSPQMIRAVPQELYSVVRSDLVDLCREALVPAWPAAEAARRTPAGVYAQRLDRLLGEYGARVRRHGLMTAPEFGRDLAPRDALMTRVWSESPAASTALRTGVGGDMTQLCRSGQLGYLSTVAAPGLVRFAPQQLRRVLERDSAHHRLAADPGIAWSEGGEFVGALRLLPLRPESVRQVLGGAQ